MMSCGRTYIMYMAAILLLLAMPAARPSATAQGVDCRSERLCRKAKQYINKHDFEKAMKYLVQARQKDPTCPDACIMMGDIYDFTLHPDSAFSCYAKAITLIGEPDPMLYYVAAGEGAKSGRYADALPYYEMFMEKGTQYADVLDDARRGIANCRFGIEAMKNPVHFKLQNLGDAVNSEYDEYLASTAADESELIFTVKRPKDERTVCAFCVNEEDLYVSEKKDSLRLPRRPLPPPVKSGYNEGAQCISPDGQYLLYTICNTDFGMGSCDLYWSKRIGEKWSRPRNFGAPVNTADWESHPSMAPDGKTIYFASSRPGGLGGMDIWQTTMTSEGEFTDPVNLGFTVNTTGDDAAPFIHSDGRTLYFASNGRVGMGGYDLYYATLQPNGTWSNPVNLGYPVNTAADEINIFINASGTVAYMASDKEGGYGGLDLYSFPLDESLRPNPVTYIKGIVRDATDGHPLQAQINLIDLQTGQVATHTASDAETGEFLACIQTGCNILLNVSHPDYPFYSENFQIEKSYSQLKPYLKDIQLQRADEGTVVILKNIFFDFDRSTLQPESYVELDKLAEYLQHAPVKIEIGGHTDNRGDDNYNNQLSQQRAKAVYDYLIDKGITAERLSYRGYGKHCPVADNDTEEGRAANRRTEFRIVK